MNRRFPPLDCLTCVFVPLSFILTYTIYPTCMQTKRRSEQWQTMAVKGSATQESGRPSSTSNPSASFSNYSASNPSAASSSDSSPTYASVCRR
jgi:hypothetical protein